MVGELLKPGIKFSGIVERGAGCGDFLVTDSLIGVVVDLMEKTVAADDLENSGAWCANSEHSIANV